jgi:hypothetical protein
MDRDDALDYPILYEKALAEIGRLTKENLWCEEEIGRLKAALAKKQEPEGWSEERVARWLRGRGYVSYRTGGQVEDGSG